MNWFSMSTWQPNAPSARIDPEGLFDLILLNVTHTEFNNKSNAMHQHRCKAAKFPLSLKSSRVCSLSSSFNMVYNAQTKPIRYSTINCAKVLRKVVVPFCRHASDKKCVLRTWSDFLPHATPIPSTPTTANDTRSSRILWAATSYPPGNLQNIPNANKLNTNFKDYLHEFENKACPQMRGTYLDHIITKPYYMDGYITFDSSTSSANSSKLQPNTHLAQ
jgi:hypothetical protein